MTYAQYAALVAGYNRMHDPNATPRAAAQPLSMAELEALMGSRAG